MSTEWNGLRFFEALRDLGPVRVISRSGPSIFESICSLDGFGVAEGHLTAITPAYHWHVDLARFRHLTSCDAMHERSGRRVLFFELREEPGAEPFLLVYLHREKKTEFDEGRLARFMSLHADLAPGRTLVQS
jgi:hypothetical protein